MELAIIVLIAIGYVAWLFVLLFFATFGIYGVIAFFGVPFWLLIIAGGYAEYGISPWLTVPLVIFIILGAGYWIEKE